MKRELHNFNKKSYPDNPSKKPEKNQPNSKDWKRKQNADYVKDVINELNGIFTNNKR